ncbi:MAG: DUF3108 domain-containing protein [Alphaproteobacteria bacterium]
MKPLLILLCFFVFVPMSGQAQSLPKVPPIIVNYDVYVGGLHLVTSEVLIHIQSKTYRSVVKAKTYGFWHRVLPWDTTLIAKGKVVGHNFVPTEYSSNDVWEHKPKITKLRFHKGNVTAEFDPPNTDQNREIVTPEQRRGARDPVSALLQMLGHLAVYGNCNVAVNVFDGKRLFGVTDSDDGTEEIDADEYGVFKGEARTCNADFTMIAGEWKERKPSRFWQKSDAGAGRDPFRIWTAKIAPELPEMAVKLESDSVFGPIIINLSGWRHATLAELKP